MGKIIICSGKRAKTPYQFESGRVRIYSMEELCYYIYHFIEAASEEILKKELIDFIHDELNMPERAEYLLQLLKKGAGIKDMTVGILCSSDYYGEKEIKEVLAELDSLVRLKPIQRRKRKTDRLMKQENYRAALREYRLILNSSEFSQLDSIECGDVLHNLAVIEARAGAFPLAAEHFLRAYEKNRRKESFKQYLFSLRLMEQEELFIKSIKSNEDFNGLAEEMESEFFHVKDTEEQSLWYRRLMNMLCQKEIGKVTEYFGQLDLMMDELKQEYRKGCI